MTKIFPIVATLLLFGCAGLSRTQRCGSDSACAFAICADGGCELFAQNKNTYPVTMTFEMKTEGLYHKRLDDQIIVVDSNQVLKIGYLTYNGFADQMSIQLNAKIAKGSYKAVHESGYLYRLPYKKGEKYPVGQGYDGAFTHKNESRYSIDFGMEIGDTVCAARGGVVIEIKEDSDVGCPSVKCEEHGNYVDVLHRDGTIAKYAHLLKNGSLVRVGDHVSDGAPIAISGATGYVSGPHLHFMVSKVNSELVYESLPTKFLTKSGVASKLVEGKEYVSD